VSFLLEETRGTDLRTNAVLQASSGWLVSVRANFTTQCTLVGCICGEFKKYPGQVVIREQPIGISRTRKLSILLSYVTSDSGESHHLL
jgi:hypothetical protein